MTKHRLLRHPWALAAFVAGGLALVLVGGLPWWKVVIAALACYLIFRVGFVVIGSFAQPIPEPPPPGELRRVRLNFRCTLCGTEVRMTVANDEMPNPPRHCQEDMELVAPIIE